MLLSCWVLDDGGSSSSGGGGGVGGGYMNQQLELESKYVCRFCIL